MEVEPKNANFDFAIRNREKIPESDLCKELDQTSYTVVRMIVKGSPEDYDLEVHELMKNVKVGNSVLLRLGPVFYMCTYVGDFLNRYTNTVYMRIEERKLMW
jgi:hypothetical protein